jgi:uncharacterized protein (TIGR00725 family)
MCRTRRIIGIIGGSTNVQADVVAMAHDMGAAVAAAEAIVLTGGWGGQRTVKDAAVDGAAGGRVISIVKRGQGVRFRTLRHLVVESGMRDARNVLNAFTADVLVALPGGGGTLSEVAFASVAGRPVIFLDSRVDLARHLNGMGSIAREAVTTFGDARFAEEHLKRAVEPLLNDGAADAADIPTAVKRALLASIGGMLPDVPGQPTAVRDYTRLLVELQT